MTDEVDLLRVLRPPATGPDPALVASERDALMTLMTERDLEGPVAPRDGPRRRRRLVWRVGVAVALTGTAAAAGWAVLQRDPALSTEIHCPDGDVIDPATGDPVADCAAAWRDETGTEPPPLRAYTDDYGNVYVLEAGEAPLSGWAPLEDGFRQDVRVGQLEDELDDVGRGFDSGCFTRQEALLLVTSQFERLGLDDWTVRVDPPSFPNGSTPGPETCATYVHYMDDEQPRQVVIRAFSVGDTWSGPSEARELARSLYEHMVTDPAHRCLTLDEALSLARDEAERLGFDLAGPGIGFETLEAPSGSGPICARPATWVGGLVQVVLREVPASQM